MRRVWICQCLCGPAGHCITAAFDEAEGRQEARQLVEDVLRDVVDGWLKSGAIRPWCGLCRAPLEGWVFELQETGWKSRAEAEPELRAGEAEQLVTAAIFGDLGQRPN